MSQPSVARHTMPGTASGAELLALCQTAAVDGSLSARELKSLHAWRAQAGDSSYSASEDFVRQIVDRILTVGKVPDGELQALQTAVEPALPLELRRRPNLRVLPSDEFVDAVDAEDVERLNNEVLASARFVVANCHRRANVIAKHARTGDPVVLVRDTRSDSLSPHAVKVCVANGKQIGFIPEQHAKELAPLLDQGARYTAHLTRLLPSEHAPVAVVQAYLYSSHATLGSLSAGTRRLTRSRLRGSWPVVRIVVGVLIAALVAVALRG